MRTRASLSVLITTLALGSPVVACKSRTAEVDGAPAAAAAKAGQAGEAGADPSEVDGSGSMAFASAPCEVAMAVVERLDIYRGLDDRSLEPKRIEEILSHRVAPTLDDEGISALDWLAAADLRLGRMSENAAVDVALLDEVRGRLGERDQDGLRRDLALIVTQLRAVAFLDMRRLLGEVAAERLEGDEAKRAWAEARCLWDGGLVRLAARADALPHRGGEGWTTTINDAFDAGQAALDADANIDIVAVKVAKQQIEKGFYAVGYHLIVAAAQTKAGPEASEALGLLDALEDRLADRNGPGLARMRMAFSGDPAALDPAVIERELGVAFTKRARKYCDKAVLGGELGTPDAIAETWEGIVYTRVVVPSMAEALGPAGFDADAYLADWQSYLEAVEAADSATAAEISPRLVEWNCAYQDKLGIAECSAGSNETQ